MTRPADSLIGALPERAAPTSPSVAYVLILSINVDSGSKQYVGPFDSYAKAKAYGIKVKADPTEHCSFIEVVNLYPAD